MTAGAEPFFKIPNVVIDEAGLGAIGAYEIAVFAVLARHRNTLTGECFPGIAKIAKMAGVSRPRVTKSIRALVGRGLLQVRVDTSTHSQKHIYRFPSLDAANRETSLTGQLELPVNNRRTKPGNHVSPNKTNRNKTKNVSVENRRVDPRHSEFIEVLRRYWDHANHGTIGLTWDESEGAMLKKLLAANPTLDAESFRKLLANRLKSDAVVHSARPRRWLSTVTDYTAPLDRFGKLKGAANGTGNRNHTKGLGNFAALAEFIGAGEGCHQP